MQTVFRLSHRYPGQAGKPQSASRKIENRKKRNRQKENFPELRKRKNKRIETFDFAKFALNFAKKRIAFDICLERSDDVIAAALQCRKVPAESLAGQFAGSTFSTGNRDAEESNLEPGSRAFHRISSRLHTADARGRNGCAAVIRRD
jgi:hypothetical protein